MLVERGFSVKICEDMIDEGGPTVFILATVFTEHDGSTIHGWVQKIVEPLGGDVWEAGYADAGIDAADHVTMRKMITNDNAYLRLAATRRVQP